MITVGFPWICKANADLVGSRSFITESKIQNFHLMAKNRIVFYEKSVRDMEMDLMNEKRQAKFRK